MKVSPDYKRFKYSTITGDTFTLLDVRSSIIRKNQTQNIEIDTPKTDRIPFNVDHTFLSLPYADMIITGHTVRPDGYMLHGQVFKKPKTYLNNEIIPILVYYSYATKYHKLTSMFVPGYQCSNIYINVVKRASMNKDIQ